jgi:osmotically-inducible protein OsmY
MKRRGLRGLWMTLFWAAGLALLVSGCSRDGARVAIDDVQAEINDALKDARIDHVQPVWDAERREMKLRGLAIDAEEKRQAEQVASSTLRDRGRVINEVVISMRGAPEPAPVVAESDDLEQIDDRIQKDVEALFADKTVWKGRVLHIVVRTGEVHLSGTALSQEDKDRITEMIARVAGVKEVVNRLEVKARKART